jgi:hypothetical protein
MEGLARGTEEKLPLKLPEGRSAQLLLEPVQVERGHAGQVVSMLVELMIRGPELLGI